MYYENRNQRLILEWKRCFPAMTTRQYATIATKQKVKIFAQHHVTIQLCLYIKILDYTSCFIYTEYL